MTFFNATDAPDGVNAPSFGRGTLMNESAAALPVGTTVFPNGINSWWYVGSASYLTLVFAPSISGAIEYNVEFFGSQNAADLVTLVTYSKIGGLPTVDIIPIVGPYMHLAVVNTGPANASQIFIGLGFGSVPEGSLGGFTGPFGIAGRVLATIPFQAIPANSNLVVGMEANVPGAGIMTLFGETQVFTSVVLVTAGPAINLNAGIASIPAGSFTATTVPIILPNDDWELEITNRGAAAAKGLATVMSAR